MKSSKKSAQSLIEYGLILALVAVVAVTVLGKFGKTMTNMADTTNSSVSNAANNASDSYCKSIKCTGVDKTTGLCTGCPE